jgi:drug/metabolite transporter (DMT)-like permease
LVGSSIPAFMLGMGALFFGQRITRRQVVGALLSIAGVLLVLAHGHLERLAQVRFVAGDLYMLVATASWAALQLAADAARRPAGGAFGPGLRS